MPVICQLKRKPTGYKVPSGGEVLWYGLAANVPDNFVIDAFMANVFVRGAAVGGSSNTPVGSDSHTHTNPASTGTDPNHDHPIGAASVGDASGSDTMWATGTQRYAEAAHSHGSSASTSGSAGSHAHTLSTTVAADLFPPYKRLYLIRATEDAEFPVGAIVMWNAAIAGRPNGTQLCNGSNGTLDLRNYFIYGAANDSDLGDAGGNTTHSHANANTGSAGSHSHTFTVPISGDDAYTEDAAGTGTTVAAHVHGHGNWLGSTGSQANHLHTVPATNAQSNIPSYCKLYFIMRTV